MLVIGSDQFQQLGNHVFDEFVARAISQAQDDWPEVVAAMGKERVASAVKVSIDMARKLGFETEFDVGRFVLLAFALRSLGFLREQWAVTVLEATLPPREKMNRLFESALASMPD
jgi:hypothetical protein